MESKEFESKFLTNPVSDELLELSSNDYEDSVPLARLEEVAEQKRTNLALRKLWFGNCCHIKEIWKRQYLIKLITLINISIKEGMHLGKYIEVESYRPIALPKLFKKLILNRLKVIFDEYTTEKSLEHQILYTIFLDITQVFDRVWHDCLLHKLKSILPYSFYQVVKWSD